MLQPTTKTIDGVQVTLMPIPILDASHLDARLLAMLMPLMASLDLTDLSRDIDVSIIAGKLSSVLGGLSKAAQQAILVDSLMGSTVVAPGCAAVEVRDPATFNQAFSGCSLETLYKVLWEAWKFNKLTPFVLAERFGVRIAPMATLGQQPDAPSRPGLKLAK